MAVARLAPRRHMRERQTMVSSLAKDRRRPGRRGGPDEQVRGGQASFMLRRTGFAPLLVVSLLLTVLTSALVTTALASFGAMAVPAAVRLRLATGPVTSIVVSGQIGARTADADLPVIRSALRSALPAIPFAILSGRWSDHFALPGSAANGLALRSEVVLLLFRGA